MEGHKLFRLGAIGLLLAAGCTPSEKHIGGVWGASTPKNNSVVTANKIRLDFHAYPAPGYPKVKEVIFTGWWPGVIPPDPKNNPSGWEVLCDDTNPDTPDNNIYSCDFDLKAHDVPPGGVSFSTTVKSETGETNDAPEGTINIIYQPSN